MNLVKDLITLLACVLSIYIFVFLTQSIAPSTYTLANQQRCAVEHFKTKNVNNVFRVYVPSKSISKGIAHLLCEKLLVGSDYSDVEVSWKHKSLLTSIDFSSRTYDLIYLNEAYIDSYFPHYQQHYVKHTGAEKRTLYLVSNHNDELEISDAKIGLLKDPLNYDGHIRPIAFLAKYFGEFNISNLRYYSNTESLITAFNEHKVDYIPLTSDSDLSPYKIKILVEKEHNFYNWYAHKQLNLDISPVLMSLTGKVR